MFRVAHDTDPVTMVPPTSGPFRFTHVPCDRPGHVISLKGLINPWDHLMERYVRSVANKNWKNVERGMRVCQMTDHEGEVLLESIAHNRGGVIQMFGAGTARVLGAALMWRLRKAIGGAALAGASSFTVLDHLCLMRERLSDCTRDAKLAGKFKTVMGGILGYLGQVAPLAMEVTLHTVSWVISLLRSACERMARSALASVG